MDEPVYEIQVHGKDGVPARPINLWTDPFFRIAHGATELKARLDRAKWYGLEATYQEVPS